MSGELGWLLGMVPFLLLLACPLVMRGMMRGMRSADGPAREAALEREVALLRARVADLDGGPVRGAADAVRESATEAGL